MATNRNRWGNNSSYKTVKYLKALLKCGQIDERARMLTRAYLADRRVAFSRQECNHVVWVMGHLVNNYEIAPDIQQGAKIMMRYCYDGAGDEIREKFKGWDK